jgi:hypothetical protein
MVKPPNLLHQKYDPAGDRLTVIWPSPRMVKRRGAAAAEERVLAVDADQRAVRHRESDPRHEAEHVAAHGGACPAMHAKKADLVPPGYDRMSSGLASQEC